VIVTIHDLSQCPGIDGRIGLCRRGVRTWCAAQGIDWLDFVANGIDAEVLTATGDAMALRLVQWAEQREAERG
jgi:hypothetical protein